MNDLIYLDNWEDYRKIEKLLREQYPNCIIEHAPKPDGIGCQTRMDFKCEGLEEDEYYKFLVQHGFVMESFTFNLRLMKAKDEKDKATLDKYFQMANEVQ
jgi:hypothetical protein